MYTLMSNLPMLTAENYNNWKFRVETILAEKQVLEVTNIVNIDDEPDVEKRLILKTQDAKAKSIIVSCITDKHLSLIKETKTSHQMLQILQANFQRKSVISKLHLKRKLLTLKCGKNEKLEDFFVKFEDVIKEIENVGTKMDESDKVCHLLLTMNEDYDTVITAIDTVDANNLTMEFVKSRLLDAELKIKNRNESQEKVQNETTFKANHKQQNHKYINQKQKCQICGRNNHKQEDCWYKNKKFNKNKQRNKQANRTETEEDVITFVAFNCDYNNNEFLLDSGATQNLVKEELETKMTDIKMLNKTVNIKTNGETITANTKGTLNE